MAQLAKAAKRTRLALVGHEPDLGELAAHLIGARRPLPFKKGGICRIDVGRSLVESGRHARLVRHAEGAATTGFVTPPISRFSDL